MDNNLKNLINAVFSSAERFNFESVTTYTNENVETQSLTKCQSCGGELCDCTTYSKPLYICVDCGKRFKTEIILSEVSNGSR